MVLFFQRTRLNISTCLTYTFIAGDTTFTLAYSFFCLALMNASFWCVSRKGFQRFLRTVGGVWLFQILKL